VPTAADRVAAPAERALAYGTFCLLPARRLLLEGDKPVRLGSRALEILIALVERPGDLVTKTELMARVWPSTFVEEGNLKVSLSDDRPRKVEESGHFLRSAVHLGGSGQARHSSLPAGFLHGC
jgi:DNA-binding response OmpR family regulator